LPCTLKNSKPLKLRYHPDTVAVHHEVQQDQFGNEITFEVETDADGDD
jgi:hypothetical protein